MSWDVFGGVALVVAIVVAVIFGLFPGVIPAARAATPPTTNAFPLGIPKGQYSYSNDWGTCRGRPSCPRLHQGTDILAPVGSNEVAVENGVITASGSDGGGGGIRIWLKGDSGVSYLPRRNQSTRMSLASV